MKTKVQFETCWIERRKLVSHGRLTATGITHTAEEWRTEPCGTPLFTEEERRTGICRSCAAGWTHPHNYPVEQIPAKEKA